MKKFYLGLDVGTDSVGIACTDEAYVLRRAKGRDLWAVRLFEEAHDAKARRMQRTARRRLQRRKQRLFLLQGIFAPYMLDELFFARLNNSSLLMEDKADGLDTPFSLFSDANYTDKHYHLAYPTIYHLRLALMEGESDDLRLYYLAIHHIMKYRGHFLREGIEPSKVHDLSPLFEDFNASVAMREEEEDEGHIFLDPSKAEEFKRLVLAHKGYRDKIKDCCALLGAKSKRGEAFVTLLLGYAVSPEKLFGESYADQKDKIAFRDMTDEKMEALEETFGEDFPILQAARDIYNLITFEKVLNNRSCISEAMVDLYGKHRSDLRALKDFVKAYYPHEVYTCIFKRAFSSEEVKKKGNCSYVNFVGFNKPKGVKQKAAHCKDEDFYKWLKKTLAENKPETVDEAEYARIMGELEDGTFLPKILHADGGSFPYQVNLAELEKILASLVRKFPEFGEKNEDGTSPAEKIRALFKFRIPYYVGPLAGSRSWMARKEAGKIFPWNFEDKVDLEACNDRFISNMTNSCSYLFGEKVLPKCSIYYQAFDVLNQLNGLRINEALLSVELKQRLFCDLFLKKRQVKDKDIRKYLVEHGDAKTEEEVLLSGKNGEIKANMGSYIALKNILGDWVDSHIDACEEIILLHTLFTTDKVMVGKLLEKKFAKEPAVLEKVKALKGLTFKDFGRLSKKFLCELSGGTDPVTERSYTILGELYNTGLTLNEILYGEKYSFMEAIKEENGEQSTEVTYDDVASLYLPPMARRGVWQALVMTDECVRLLGQAPDKIFVEVTRGGGEKGKQTTSRKRQLLDLYAEIEKDKELDGETRARLVEMRGKLDGVNESDLRRERLYLYYRQMGRCMYSGQPIDLGIVKTDTYEVDHILPRSFIKDDSIENKVLVLRRCNMEKGDIYPIPEKFVTESTRRFWKFLHLKGLIGDKKYSLLTRREPLGEDDYQDFVNRQLVITSQSVKAIAELLQRKFPEARVVYSKAKDVSEFREKFSIVKCRETNDLHHARDAYLNIVVGNVYDTKFTSVRAAFRRHDDGSQRQYNLKKLFERDVAGAWEAGKSIVTVKKTVAKSSMAVTRYLTTGKGMLFNETIYPASEEEMYPRKKGVFGQTEKYGGYKSLSTAYFAIVEHTLKKKRVKTIEQVPVLTDVTARGDEAAVLEYFRSQGLEEPKLLVPKLRIGTLVEVYGMKVRLASTTGKQITFHNAVQWFTDGETDAYIKGLGKCVELMKNKMLIDDGTQEAVPVDTNRFGEVTLEVNVEKNLALYELIRAQLARSVYGELSPVKVFRANLEKGREKFVTLSTADQARVLLQIIKFLKCNAELSDITLIGGSSQSGKLQINKNITGIPFTIFKESPCGFTVRAERI